MGQSVIVVGAGVIGASIAWQLSKAGHHVRIIDGGGAPATAASFGWVNASFFLNEEHHQLRQAGIAAWHRVMREVSVEIDWQGCLCWDLAAEEMAATYTKLRAWGYPAERLGKAEVAAREPALMAVPDAALLFPSEGAAASGQLAAQFLSAAQARGTQHIQNAHVQGLKTRGDRVVGVETANGALEADHVVIAAGTGTAALAGSIGTRIPLVPRPAYIMRTSPQPLLLNHILATPEGEVRQEPSGQLLMPIVAQHQSDTAETLEHLPTDAADDAMARLRKLIAGLDDVNWVQVSRAERPMPEDGFPIVGPIADGASVAVLHSGITLGAVIGELVAKDITASLSNEEAAMLAPYRPDRFASL